MTSAGSPTPGFPWASVSLLGWLTIVGYGTWYYAFGVLLEPVLVDTGWPEQWVVTGFSITGLLGSLAAPMAGRLLDGGWAKPLLGLTGVGSAAALWLASTVDGLVSFVVYTAVGGGLLAAFAFYHVTQTLAVRLAPDAASRGVGVLTLYGAFASTIYLPLTAHLVETADWRIALRVLAAGAGVSLTLGAVALPGGTGAPNRSGRSRRGELLADPAVRRYAIASAGIGVSAGIVLVYQVTIMTLAGLSLTSAAWLAGARGTTQFVGRLPVIWAVDRIGSARSLQLAFASIAIGCAFLAFSGHIAIGLVYVVFGGVGIGATSPLQGIHGAAIFPDDRLGEGMGTLSLVFGAAMAAGPVAVSVAADGDDVRWLGPIVAVVGAVLAVTMMRSPAYPDR